MDYGECMECLERLTEENYEKIYYFLHTHPLLIGIRSIGNDMEYANFLDIAYDES